MMIAEVSVGSINMYRMFLLPMQHMEEQEIPNQPVPCVQLRASWSGGGCAGTSVLSVG